MHKAQRTDAAATMTEPPALDKRKVQLLEKLFKTDEERELDASKRMQELAVLESELNSLKAGARIYRGEVNTVLFKADLTQVKSDIKKELAALKKIHKQTSKSDLAF